MPLIKFEGKLQELKKVCEKLGLDYLVCESRFYRGNSVEKILRPTNLKWKKKDRHMHHDVIEKELKGMVPIPRKYEGMSDESIKALLSGNCHIFLKS